MDGWLVTTFAAAWSAMDWNAAGAIIAACALVGAVHAGFRTARQERRAAQVQVKAILLIVYSFVVRVRNSACSDFGGLDDCFASAKATQDALSRANEFTLPTAEALEAYLQSRAAIDHLLKGFGSDEEPKIALEFAAGRLERHCVKLASELKAVGGRVTQKDPLGIRILADPGAVWPVIAKLKIDFRDALGRLEEKGTATWSDDVRWNSFLLLIEIRGAVDSLPFSTGLFHLDQATRSFREGMHGFTAAMDAKEPLDDDAKDAIQFGLDRVEAAERMERPGIVPPRWRKSRLIRRP